MQIGERLGPYELVRELGRGGSAEVWLGRHRELQVHRALKIHTGELTRGRARRLMREARIQASLSHPRVAGVHDVFKHEGHPVIVQDFVEGMELQELLDYQIAPARLERILADLLTGLSTLHAAGIVHRDLKPSNIIVSPGGRAFILDLGIACQEGESRYTRAGTLMGTPAYMAPEQADDATAATIRSDLFSVGCIALTLLLGDNPLRGRTLQETLLKVNDCDQLVADALQGLNRRGINGRIADLIENTVCRDPAQRVPNATAALQLLQPRDLTLDTYVSLETTLPRDDTVTLSRETVGLLGLVGGASLASAAATMLLLLWFGSTLLMSERPAVAAVVPPPTAEVSLPMAEAVGPFLPAPRSEQVLRVEQTERRGLLRALGLKKH